MTRHLNPCDAIGHQYGTSSEDFVCYGCGAQACDPAAIAPDWAERQERAYRVADFFDGARAARDDEAARGDVAAHETVVLAERFRLVGGYSESAPERARIIGTYGLGYLVRFLSDDVEALAFPSEIRTVR